MAAVTTVKLDPTTGDLYEENGNQVILEGVEAIKQTLLSRLHTFMGEVFTDLTKGVPYFQEIMGQKGANLADIGGIFRRVVLASPGIVSCQTVTVTVDDTTRAMAVTFDCKAETGETITVVNEELI